MQFNKRRLLILIVVVALSSAGQVFAAGGKYTLKIQPVKKVKVEGTDKLRLILTPKAVRRIDLQLFKVAAQTGKRQIIPYSSILYGVNGETWIYTQTDPLTYMKQLIAVDRIEKDSVILSIPLPVGTDVVVTGAAELFGVEFGAGK